MHLLCQLLHESNELASEWSVTLLLLLVLQMWKATAGHTVSISQDDGADDWETDPDFVVWLWGFTDAPGACSGTVPEELCRVGAVSWQSKLSGAGPWKWRGSEAAFLTLVVSLTAGSFCCEL